MHRTKVGIQGGFDYILVTTYFSIIGYFKKILVHHLCAKNFTRYFHKQRKKLLPPGTYNQINKQDLGGMKRVITSLKELKTKKVDCTLR